MQLLWIALATLASEDLALLAAGALVAQRRIGLAEATLAATAGIFAGDMLLFLSGRLAWRSRWFAAQVAKRVPRRTLDRVSGWLEMRGLAVVLLSRLTPGMRLPTYVAAGLLSSSHHSWRFAWYFLIAASIWTPLLVAGSAFLGEHLLPRFGYPAFAALGLTVVASQALSNPATRSRIKGFLLRKVRWEFWPAWAAYLPLLPYFLYLAIKHRSLTLFTLANPGIESGGFVGESKFAILRHLSRVPGAVAPFALVDNSTAIPDSFPVVLKPDQGERGKGVAIIRSREQWTEYWSKTPASARIIAQQYVSGEEFGIYYVRYPGESRGRIPSITAKTFPQVTGDGVHTVHELVLKDHRAVCMAGAYAQALGSKAEQIPGEGEQVQLVEIGSHCRGSIFLNATHLVTDALTEAVDRGAKAHPGFHIGRFDVRSASASDLREGRFQVIELNGVSAEPAHIYDPQVSLVDAYRALMWQWRTAFEIGSLYRNAGIQPMNVSALVRRIAGE